MNRLASTLLVSLVAVATACGGGSGGGGGAVVPDPPGGSGTLNAGFTPAEANPGPDTVAMKQGSANGDLVTVEVDITDVSGVYGVAFDVVYDSSNATFENWVPGTLLEQGGQTPTYQISSITDRVVVAATRQGNLPGANAAGRVTVIRLRFRVRNPGAFGVSFQSQTLFDDQVPPQQMAGIDWFAGTLVGN